MKALKIIFPLHIYSEGELETLKAGFEKAENAPAVARISAELAIRQDEYEQRMNPPKSRKRKAYPNAA